MTGESPRTAPLPNTYWVIPGGFLAGELPSAPDERSMIARQETLFGAGIRVIFNLMEADERDFSGRPFRGYEACFTGIGSREGCHTECRRFPIRDLSVPSEAQLEAILAAIDATLAAGRPLYLHCWGGIGRTGTVVGSWLARHGLATGEAALALLHRLRETAARHAAGHADAGSAGGGEISKLGRASPETAAQRDLVRHWPPMAPSPTLRLGPWELSQITGR